MSFSTTYTIYPGNRRLEQAIAHYVSLVSGELAEAARPDHDVTAKDNFRYARGNYEQQRFSASVCEDAIRVFDAASSDGLREQDLDAWITLQISLGNVLAAIGQQRMDEESYRRAIDVFRHARDAVNQAGQPEAWAEITYNLATANQALGRLLPDTKLLKSAVDGYTEALLVWSREQAPQNWMMTMHQLGATLHTFGLQLKGNRHFQKSVVAYKNALAALDADNYPLELTATHNNRAVALHHLAESEENPERLQEAIKSYEKALTVSMEQQLPVHVSVLCRVNKATAQNVLAEMTGDALLASEMADEFDVILECFTESLQPLCARHCAAQLEKARTLESGQAASA